MVPFQTGVLGCGRISAVYLDILTRLQQEGVVQVKIAVDKNPQAAEDFARHFEGCRWGTTMEDLIDAHPHTVHILTPHFLHAEQAIQCLEAGIHVLCEKPIAIHLEDADRMIAAAEKSQKQLGIIYQNRYLKGVQEAKALIDSGQLGKIKGAWSSLHWWRPPSYYQCDWKGSWDKEGGGVVIDQAIHSIDLVRYMLGCEAVQIKASIDRRVLQTIEVEDVASAAITFENGAVYAFSACNYYTENDPIQIKLSCEKGTIYLSGDTVTITREQAPPLIIPPSEEAGCAGLHYWGAEHSAQVRDFYHCLSSGKAVPFRPEDAKKTLEIVQGIYYSSYTGKACAVSADLPRRGTHYL